MLGTGSNPNAVLKTTIIIKIKATVFTVVPCITLTIQAEKEVHEWTKPSIQLSFGLFCFPLKRH